MPKYKRDEFIDAIHHSILHVTGKDLNKVVLGFMVYGGIVAVSCWVLSRFF